MARQFIDLQNLTTYDSHIKQVISDEDAKSLKAAALNGKKLELFTIENPSISDTPRFSITLPFVEQEIVTAKGKSLVCNEASGGGAKFENVDGTWSFTGVNDGGEEGITGQLYTVKKVNNKYVGTRLNMTLNGFYYTNGANSSSYTADDEIATKGDIAAISSADKTVYVVETTGGSSDPFSKKYDFYQGSEGSSITPVASEKLTSIAIAKDMFVESGTVGTVETADVPYPGAKVGDKYIDLVLANASSDHIYIPANSLVDIYTAAPNATEVQLAIDGNNQISASIVEINGSKLTDGSVTKAKLATGVQDSLDLADSALQPESIDSVPDEDIEALFNTSESEEEGE